MAQVLERTGFAAIMVEGFRMKGGRIQDERWKDSG